MPRNDLTPKEKMALVGLSRFPTLNDRELAEMLREKMSTVTSIRRRLRERNYYHKVMMPNFKALGCEVMAVCHGGFASGFLVDMKKAAEKGLFKVPEDISFLSQVGAFSWLELGAFPDYTTAKRKVDVMWARLSEMVGNVPTNPCVQNFYPLDHVVLHNLFDYTPLLVRLLKTDVRRERPRAAPRVPARKLSAMEKLVLYGLVKWPDAPDKAVAEKLSVSRQAVARIRKLLVREGWLVPKVVPDLRTLEFEVVVYLGFHLNPLRPLKLREQTALSMIKEVPHFFSMSTEHEVVLLGAYCSFAEFERSINRLIRRLDDEQLLERAPEMQGYLMADVLVIKDHDYAPLVKALLGLDMAD